MDTMIDTAHVLVVDDEGAIRYSVSKTLQRIGYQVHYDLAHPQLVANDVARHVGRDRVAQPEAFFAGPQLQRCAFDLGRRLGQLNRRDVQVRWVTRIKRNRWRRLLVLTGRNLDGPDALHNFFNQNIYLFIG